MSANIDSPRSPLLRQVQRERREVFHAYRAGFWAGLFIGCFGAVLCVALTLWMRG